MMTQNIKTYKDSAICIVVHPTWWKKLGAFLEKGKLLYATVLKPHTPSRHYRYGPAGEIEFTLLSSCQPNDISIKYSTDGESSNSLGYTDIVVKIRVENFKADGDSNKLFVNKVAYPDDEDTLGMIRAETTKAVSPSKEDIQSRLAALE